MPQQHEERQISDLEQLENQLRIEFHLSDQAIKRLNSVVEDNSLGYENSAELKMLGQKLYGVFCKLQNKLDDDKRKLIRNRK